MNAKNYISFEISHELAPVSIRERFSFNAEELKNMIQTLKGLMGNVFVLSTCNRFSVYAEGGDLLALSTFFSNFGDSLQYGAWTSTAEETSQKLFETAAGLNSQLLGEHEILGQIRNAMQLCKELGSLSSGLQQLIEQALHVGKKIRTETNFGKSALSHAGVTLQAAQQHFGSVEGKSVLVIGTGDLAGKICQVLKSAGAKKEYFASHSPERVTELQQQGYQAMHIRECGRRLHEFDIVVGSTHQSVSFLNEPVNSNCERQSFGAGVSKRMLFVDLGMPRNFNSTLKQLEGIQLMDLDDLKAFVQEGQKDRIKEIPEVKEIVASALAEFKLEEERRAHHDVLGDYWNHMVNVKEDRLEWLLPKLDGLTEQQMQVIERFAHHMIRDLSRGVFQQVKNAEGSDARKTVVDNISFLNSIRNQTNKS